MAINDGSFDVNDLKCIVVQIFVTFPLQYSSVGTHTK